MRRRRGMVKRYPQRHKDLAAKIDLLLSNAELRETVE
jgi:hypothetical protein